MQTAKMNAPIRSAFQDCQDSFSTHPKIVKKLRNFYDSVEDQEAFFKCFIYYLKFPISGVHERSNFLERILEFVAKFACSFLGKEEKKKNEKGDGETDKKAENDINSSLEDEDQEEEEEEEMPFFMHRLFDWLLDNHNVEGVDARLHVCQLLNKLLKYMGIEASIDDDLYNKIYYGMLERLKDRVADIRSQAVTALQRLQDPKDENCPIIKAYLFHLAHDPNSIVRRTIVRCIGATRLTLPHILERTRDVDEGVRRASYKFLAEKVHIKSLTIGQREGVLQRGLKERSDAARKVVEKELIPSWLRLSNHNIIQFLHHLDVGNCEQNFKVGQQMSAPSGALEVIFKDITFNELVSNFQYLDERKLVPADKLTPETALYWRVLIQFLSKEATDEQVDKLRPELTPFCEYVRGYVITASSEADDDDLNWEFIAKELIIMTSFYDLGDEVGRRNLVRLVKDLLISDKTTPSLIPQLMHIFTKVEKNAQSRIDQIAEVIAELKDPMTVEPAKALESEPMDTTEQVDQKLIRALNLEIAKLRVDMTSQQDALDGAIAEQDFVKAQEIKMKMLDLEAKRSSLEADIQAEQNKATAKVAQLSPEILQQPGSSQMPGSSQEIGSDDPAVTLKCLKLLVATLQDPGITQLNATLHTLLEEMVVVSVQSEIAKIRKEAIQALACFCLRSVSDACTHMLLLLQAAHIDVSEVRIAAIAAVIDLLMRHGLSAFITAGEAVSGGSVDRRNTSGTEGDLSETSSSIETALDSDMATRGAALSQAELNAQGGNSVVVILSKMLDEPDLELRTEVAEGLCKLLMIGAISSPKLLSRLLLMWYNPMTESDSKLRHILGTFFPLYASMSKVHQMALESSFIPTMKVLFDAPITSPLADIDTEDVGMFLVHLTREDLLQTFQPSRPTVESEVTESSVHDTLAFTVCNEILSAPDSFQTKVLVKLLCNLQITTNNYVSLRELKVLSEQLLTHVREKLCRKSLEKFDRNITEWLARDPSKLAAAATEKRPASAAEISGAQQLDETAATPGKKKRFLFSQSSMNNSLLVDPEADQTSRTDESEASGLFATPRRIPSPVATSRVPVACSTQINLEDAINKTKDLELSDTTQKSSAADSEMADAADNKTGPSSPSADTAEESSEISSAASAPSSLSQLPDLRVIPDTPESSSIPSSQESDSLVPDTPESAPRRSVRSSASSRQLSSAESGTDDSPASYRRLSRRSSPAPAVIQKQKSAKESGKSNSKQMRKEAVSKQQQTPKAASKEEGSPKRGPRHVEVPSSPGSPKRGPRHVEVPSSPGISRAGRRNSPRIDYRTGKSIESVADNKENSPSVLPPVTRRSNSPFVGNGVADKKTTTAAKEKTSADRQQRRSNSPFVNGVADKGSKNLINSKDVTASGGRKRVHPPPSQESRNSSPILRTKTSRNKTPPRSVGKQSSVAGIKALPAGKAASEIIRRSNRKTGGSDSDSSLSQSPSLRRSKRK